MCSSSGCSSSLPCAHAMQARRGGTSPILLSWVQLLADLPHLDRSEPALVKLRSYLTCPIDVHAVDQVEPGGEVAVVMEGAWRGRHPPVHPPHDARTLRGRGELVALQEL